MQRKVLRTIYPLLGVLSTAVGLQSIESPVAYSQPNIVHIFADDLGWGSVGFNGQTLIQTPNIDALAAAGMKFNNAYAATVCGPARAMLYSGYHNGHTLVDRNGNLGGSAWRDDGETVGHYLQDAGYNTAVFGKWGFGGSTAGNSVLRPNPVVEGTSSLPTTQGFQEFYGYLNHGRAHSYRVDSLWTTTEPADDDLDGIDEVGEKYQPNQDNGLWLEKTGNHSGNLNVNYTADLVTDKALQYIGAKANQTQPFYLQYASTIPHFEINSIRNFPGWFDDYVDPNTGLDIVPGAGSWTNQQKSYAAMITLLDAQVGELIAKLSDPDGDPNTDDSVMQDTLIMFTSDNGATAERETPINFFDANGKRGGKRDLWDGGINVPTFAYWEGTIAGGQSSDLYTDLSDFMPTALELAGVEGRVGMDGVSIVHELTGQGIDRKKDYLVQEHHGGDGPDPDNEEGRWAIIKDDHKLIKYRSGIRRLYNLVTDPDENNELDLVANAAMVDEFTAIALAEGAEEGDSYTVHFQDWVGSDGGDLEDPNNWAGTANSIAAPNVAWSAVINNAGGTTAVASTGIDTTLLGLEVKGDGAQQTVRPNRFTTLTGRNEVRISNGGRINLDQATLATVRWVDVKLGGELTGHGDVQGDVYNWGTIAPGLPTDLPQPDALPSGPPSVDTGVVSAIVFDFTGTQDGLPNSFVGTNNGTPLTSTSSQNQYLTLVSGLDFTGAPTPRHTTKPGSTDVGDEFNVSNWGTGISLTDAVNGNRYISFTVEPVFGVEMLVDTVSFDLWRNGVNAPTDYAIMTSVDSFTPGNEIAFAGGFVDEGISNDLLLTGTYAGGQWTTDEVEVRLYGWNAGNGGGNTHVTGASMTASFRSVVPGGGDPNVALNPTGELTLNGDFFHVDNAMIAMDLGGTSLLDPLDPEYDRLIVTGAVELAGDLTVALVDSFNPTENDTFDLFDFGSVTGAFDLISLPSLDPGLEWDTSSLLVDGTISVVAYNADYNDDGFVNGRDFLSWQRGNSPNPLSSFDLALWESQNGTPASSTGSLATVPEPSSLVLMFLLGTSVATLRRRESR